MAQLISPALVAVLSLPACGAGTAAAGSPAAEVHSDSLPSYRALPRVEAGAYRLSMSAPCQDGERSESGTLTLERIAGPELLQADSPPVVVATDTSLLWGQTDLDFESLRSCLGGPTPDVDEPIHSSVLVEVLRWDGEPHHQVLLVSTDPRHGGAARAASGAGVAMWVERAEQGHLAGVWSRWEVAAQGEGRWVADRVNAD
jgi:hypothetical protein